MIPSWLDGLNNYLWVMSNLLVAYIAIVLVIFVIGYFILFDPKATTAGKFIFRFFVSLFGVIGLIFISLFVDPRAGHGWNTYPGDVLVWRPALRFIAYSYVAYSVTGLAVLLGFRKWRPSFLRTALDRELVKPRSSE